MKRTNREQESVLLFVENGADWEVSVESSRQAYETTLDWKRSTEETDVVPYIRREDRLRYDLPYPRPTGG